MNPGRQRWLFRLAILLVLGLIALFAFLHERGCRLVIENRSEQVITELKITIAGQAATFADIKPGGEASAPCPASEEEQPFTIECKLADGKIFRFRGRIRERLHYQLLPDGQFRQSRKGWFG